MNRRDCCPDYWMGTDGCRYEAAVAGMDGWYMSALRSRTFVQRYAAQLNVNLLGFFRATRDSRWSLDLSPHIAAIGTSKAMHGGISVRAATCRLPIPSPLACSSASTPG